MIKRKKPKQVEKKNLSVSASYLSFFALATNSQQNG